ncbi:MAG: hypothetical protein CM15mP12_6050 [Gammaproteobacteria bacterium]|nr:MAG: hypothetical protein CM15mP12_6050 [Gammaproteobacteria bacterium]
MARTPILLGSCYDRVGSGFVHTAPPRFDVFKVAQMKILNCNIYENFFKEDVGIFSGTHVKS